MQERINPSRVNVRKQQADAYHREQLERGMWEISNPRYDVMLQLLRDSNTDTEQRILDIGCHFGAFLIHYLKANGYKNLMGLDTSEMVIRTFEDSGIQVVLGDIEDANVEEMFGGKCFDCIFMGDTLEHIFDPGRALRRIHNLLVPDGLLVLSVPNAGWLPNGFLLTFASNLLGLSPAFGSWTHCNQFTFHTLRETLENSGFSIVTSLGIKYSFTSYFKRRGVKQRVANAGLKLVFEILNLMARCNPPVFSPHLIVSARKI